jgi:putative heme-binding domain-containing protein
MIRALGELGNPDGVESLLGLIGSAEEAIQLQAVAAVQRFDRPDIPKALLQRYPALSGRLKTRTADVLLSRRTWARSLLEAVDRDDVSAKEIAVDQLRPLAWHNDPQLDTLVRKHWGTVAAGTPEEKLAEIRRLNNDLRAGAGEPLKGRELFRKQCATCHRLFGEGNVVGPDLTFANRKDRDYLLVSLIDPGAVIRKEYLSYVAQTTDGRLLTGLLVEQTPQRIVLLDAKNERTAIARDKLESLRESPVSLMPDNTLKELKPAELRDLFRYLQSEGR